MNKIESISILNNRFGWERQPQVTTNLMHNVQVNKDSAVGFLELVVAHKINEAYAAFVDFSGKHHNVGTPAGMAALKKAMEESDVQSPTKQIIIKNVIGEEDRVAVHSRLIFESNEMVVVHIFRFNNGKIVEFWDLGMEIPADSPNKDGLF
jgi:predicted SnoaL-like aldol condensation-catalyzing enzyme